MATSEMAKRGTSIYTPDGGPDEPAPPYQIHGRPPPAYTPSMSMASGPYSVPSAPYDYSHMGAGPSYAYPGATTGGPNTTTVILQQPVPGMGPAQRRLWYSGICDCCNDVGICCCGTFCYPCLSCQVATDMGESCCCVPCCLPCCMIALRTKMRTQQNIAGSVSDDFCMTCCCPTCALCQLAREIKLCKHRGEMIV